jgi:aminoglycoside/choline kinase family phosphotransferase
MGSPHDWFRRMSERAARIEAFLEANGWGAAARHPLPSDASFRRYERLIGGPKPALLMDAPPPDEDVRPFIAVARHLKHLGLSAPAIWAEDAAAGLLVIEDFGDATYAAELAKGADEAALYALAVDVLIALHRHPDAASVELPPYDEAAYFREAELLVDWYLPAITGRPSPHALKVDYLGLWREALRHAEAVPVSLVLRDFHIDNLMWLDDRDAIARVGLLDFQDALIGPVAYDLVSLLEDARRDVPANLIAAMTERYLAAFPDLDREAFAAASAVLSAQRNCKILGIFTRLCVRDGKPVYLKHIPRVWRWLERDLAHPALVPIRAWLDRHIPPAQRRAPARPAA